MAKWNKKTFINKTKHECLSHVSMITMDLIKFAEDNADQIRMDQGRVKFQSNNAGGILGGISTGQNLVVRFAVKPTSSILLSRKTITRQGRNTTIKTKGRHDPCVGIRGVPVGEAMMACVLADHLLRHRGQCGSE